MLRSGQDVLGVIIHPDVELFADVPFVDEIPAPADRLQITVLNQSLIDDGDRVSGHLYLAGKDTGCRQRFVQGPNAVQNGLDKPFLNLVLQSSARIEGRVEIGRKHLNFLVVPEFGWPEGGSLKLFPEPAKPGNSSGSIVFTLWL